MTKIEDYQLSGSILLSSLTKSFPKGFIQQLYLTGKFVKQKEKWKQLKFIGMIRVCICFFSVFGHLLCIRHVAMNEHHLT